MVTNSNTRRTAWSRPSQPANHPAKTLRQVSDQPAVQAHTSLALSCPLKQNLRHTGPPSTHLSWDWTSYNTAVLVHALARYASARLCSQLDDHVVVMPSTWAFCTTCLALASCPPSALAAPLHIHPRQYDADNPDTTNTDNAVVGVLSAVAAVVALGAVITLIYFPESTKRIVMRYPVVTTTEIPPPLKPEIINTTTTTTVTHTRHTSSRSSLDMLGRSSSRGGAVLAVAVNDDDGCSSIGSPGDSEFELEKYAVDLVARPPSSVLSSSRYSCHVSSDYANSESSRTSRYQSILLKRASSLRRSSGLLQKPISWLRLSSSTPTKSNVTSGATTAAAATAATTTTTPKHQVSQTSHWPRGTTDAVMTPTQDLASRRGQPTPKHLRLPIR